MTDIRFSRPNGPFSLNYIAAQVGAEPPAPRTGSILIHDIGDLETAKHGDLKSLLRRALRDRTQPNSGERSRDEP